MNATTLVDNVAWWSVNGHFNLQHYVHVINAKIECINQNTRIMKTHNKYASYFAVEKHMKEMGMYPERDEIIAEFTMGRTSSLKDLSPFEYKELIRSLNRMVNNKSQPQADAANKMRRKLIAILSKVGMTKDGKADMQRINNWCINYGFAHTHLNNYAINDLPKLISQAEEMYRKHIERL